MANSPARHHEFWWQSIIAIPPSRSEVAYERLDRIFRDQTRRAGSRGQEFTDTTHETHFTVVLWEHFALLAPSRWLPQVWSVAGLVTPLGAVQRCNWSYQWAEHGGSGARHCDLVLEYEDEDGRGVLVVEAKKPGVRLSGKDLDPGYYLTIPQIARFERKSLIYLIDDTARERDEAQIARGGYDIGFLSWERLATVQIDCVDTISGPPAVQAFVAGAMYQFFVLHGITPKVPPLPYLRSEPSAEDVVAKQIGRPLRDGDWQREIWRL